MFIYILQVGVLVKTIYMVAVGLS